MTAYSAVVRHALTQPYVMIIDKAHLGSDISI